MTQEDLIRQRFNEAEGLNFAACRLPNSDTVYFFYSDKEAKLRRLDFKHQQADFVFSPYSAGSQAYFMQSSVAYANEQCLFGDLNALQKTEHAISDVNNFEANEEFFTHYVRQIVDEIKNDKLDKAVAARCTKVALPHTFTHADFFAKLLKQFPNAMIYYINHAELGCWCGASPEKLLYAGNNSLNTVALAGTMPANTNENWGEKEKEEQLMVTDFIEQVFDKFKLNYQKQETTEMITGNIKHLCTPVNAAVPNDWLEQKFHRLLGELNPTPAVCGIPQFDASVFIGTHEKMERRFYSGFAGMIHEDKINLHVNLRCMEIGNQNAILYAGAGVTEHSNAKEEWEETEKKLQALGETLKTKN